MLVWYSEKRIKKLNMQSLGFGKLSPKQSDSDKCLFYLDQTARATDNTLAVSGNSLCHMTDNESPAKTKTYSTSLINYFHFKIEFVA